MADKAEDEAYCTTCGEIVKRPAEICPECGTRRKPAPDQAAETSAQTQTAEKDPGVAAILSFFYSELGQIYNGEILKGVGFMIVQFVNVLLIFVFVGLLTYPIVWFLGIYDAYKSAERINDANA